MSYNQTFPGFSKAQIAKIRFPKKLR